MLIVRTIRNDGSKQVRRFNRTPCFLEWLARNKFYIKELALYMNEKPTTEPTFKGLGKCRSAHITKKGVIQFKKDLSGEYRIVYCYEAK